MDQWFSPYAKDLLKGLLNRDPKKRLGCKGVQTIKDHPFFENINWESLERKEITPPFIPENAKDAEAFENIDQQFTSEMPQETPAEENHLNKQFKGFTYGQENFFLKTSSRSNNKDNYDI